METPQFKDPSKDFKPIDAKPEELAEYGFPPCPNESSDGPNDGISAWKELMRACREYLPPPPPVKTQPKPLLSKTWSGAITQPPPPDPSRQRFKLEGPGQYPPPPPPEKSDYEFFYITSTWIIPDACPPPDGDPQGQYACYSFVGFDGVSPPHPALVGGTKSICAFDCCHCAKVFIQYQVSLKDPAIQEVFDEPKVRPGDLVSAILWIVGPQFRLFIVNRNTGQYTRLFRPLPSSFKGLTAEWILGRQDLEYGFPGHAVELLPNYGATYYQRNYAEYRLRNPKTSKYVNGWETVDQAQLIDMVSEDRKEIISTAKKVGPNLLNVFAYKDEDQDSPVLPL